MVHGLPGNAALIFRKKYPLSSWPVCNRPADPADDAARSARTTTLSVVPSSRTPSSTTGWPPVLPPAGRTVQVGRVAQQQPVRPLDHAPVGLSWRSWLAASTRTPGPTLGPCSSAGRTAQPRGPSATWQHHCDTASAAGSAVHGDPARQRHPGSAVRAGHAAQGELHDHRSTSIGRSRMQRRQYSCTGRPERRQPLHRSGSPGSAPRVTSTWASLTCRSTT